MTLLKPRRHVPGIKSGLWRICCLFSSRAALKDPIHELWIHFTNHTPFGRSFNSWHDSSSHRSFAGDLRESSVKPSRSTKLNLPNLFRLGCDRAEPRRLSCIGRVFAVLLADGSNAAEYAFVLAPWWEPPTAYVASNEEKGKAEHGLTFCGDDMAVYAVGSGIEDGIGATTVTRDAATRRRRTLDSTRNRNRS
jgi:hypothetical protein